MFKTFKLHRALNPTQYSVPAFGILPVRDWQFSTEICRNARVKGGKIFSFLNFRTNAIWTNLWTLLQFSSIHREISEREYGYIEESN